MDKQNIDNLIEKNASLSRFRGDFEKMSLGAYCYHRTFGVGQINGYDAEKNRLIINFEGDAIRMMEPEFCLRKLDILHDNDMLVQFHKDPEMIRQKLKKSSVLILLEYLEQMPSHRASFGDIERTFSKIVEEKNFKRWWNVTKKLIAKEPTLRFEEGAVNYLALCEEPISEEEELMKKLDAARDVAGKTAVAEQCLALVKANNSLQSFGVEVIHVLGNAMARAKKITLAEKFQACVVRDELSKLVGYNSDELQPKLESIIAECSNLSKICDNLNHQYYRVFFEMVTRVFPDEWEKLCLSILRNCNDKLTNACIVYLKDNGCEDAVRAAFAKWLKEKSLRSALLQWIIKNRHSKKFEGVFSDELMSCELLRAILWAIDNEALLGTGKAKKIQLVELLCNDRTLIHDLLLGATDDIAGDLAQTLLINQGIDSLSKKSLLARFIAAFPNVQELVLSANKSKISQDVSLKVSLASMESKRKEYDILVKEKIPANKKAIELAREHGDLSENSEYKMARQDQDTLLSRKAQLEDELSMAEVIDMSNVDTSMVSIGSVVRLKNANTGDFAEFTILGAWDSDPAKNIISYKTNMAQSLLGRKPNDLVEVCSDDHSETWQVESIRAYM